MREEVEQTDALVPMHVTLFKRQIEWMQKNESHIRISPLVRVLLDKYIDSKR